MIARMYVFLSFPITDSNFISTTMYTCWRSEHAKECTYSCLLPLQQVQTLFQLHCVRAEEENIRQAQTRAFTFVTSSLFTFATSAPFPSVTYPC